jgi:hypothetical protein
MSWNALYGTTISGPLGTGRFSELVRIDPGTGARIGPAVPITADDQRISITDLALRPSSNTLYGTRLGEDDFTNSIYSINPATGVATLIGNTGSLAQHSPSGPTGRSTRPADSETPRRLPMETMFGLLYESIIAPL